MLAIVILAAGRGTRMKSSIPKVLHTLGGRTLLERTLESCQLVDPFRRLVIVGYQASLVQSSLTHIPNLEFVEQTEQLGTGHAVIQLLPHLQDYAGDVLVLNGDVPLLRAQTIKNLLEVHRSNNNAATILSAQVPDPHGYGRVFCAANNVVTEIIEHRDCTTAQRQNHRINAGIYCFNWSKLAEVLPKLKPNNDQNEYYLTDVMSLLKPVMAVDVSDHLEISGINDRLQLSDAYNILQDRIKENWMKAGVTLINPDSITIDDTVKIESDVIIEPQTHLRGQTIIKSGSRVGPGSLIENSQIDSNVSILYSVVSDSYIASESRIGPYAHLRGQVRVGNSCRVGNFVELKKTTIGDKTNVAHLSYLGDATLGSQVNIGAGTITANYDGVAKHSTIIGDRCKTGANSVVVAPLELSNDVTVAAGSVVTHDVPENSLVIARQRQRVIADWNKKT